MSSRVVLGAILVAAATVACGRGGSPSSSGDGSPSASATASVAAVSVSAKDSTSIHAPPRPIVRLPIAFARASAEVDEPGNARWAEHAFDGDPSGGWCVKKDVSGAWVEAELAAPQALRHVRVRMGLGERLSDHGKLSGQHGSVTHLTLVFDEGGAGKEVEVRADATNHGDVDVAVPPGLVAKKIRARVLEATKGKKHDDACIAEIEPWGDEPARDTPSGLTPTTHGAALDADVAALSSQHDHVWPLLEKLGFSEHVKKTAQIAQVRAATRTLVSLDGDAEAESMVHVTFTQTFGDYQVERHAVAVLDDAAHGEVVLGRRWLGAQRCSTQGDDDAATDPDLVSLATHAVHVPGTLDVVARALSVELCTTPVAGKETLEIWTAARGALETVASYTSTFDERNDRNPTTLFVECTGEGGTCTLRGLELTGTTYYSFEAGPFVYR